MAKNWKHVRWNDKKKQELVLNCLWCPADKSIQPSVVNQHVDSLKSYTPRPPQWKRKTENAATSPVQAVHVVGPFAVFIPVSVVHHQNLLLRLQHFLKRTHKHGSRYSKISYFRHLKKKGTDVLFFVCGLLWKLTLYNCRTWFSRNTLVSVYNLSPKGSGYATHRA